MKKIKVVNIDLNENHILTKQNNLCLEEIIEREEPDIISIVNINKYFESELNNLKILELENCIKLIDSINNELNENIVEKRHFYLETLNLLSEREGEPNGNCLSILMEKNKHFINFINTMIDKPLTKRSEYQLIQLRRLVEFYQKKIVDSQIIIGNFANCLLLKDFCMKHDLANIKLVNNMHVLTSNNMNLERLESVKIKTKSLRDIYTSTLSFVTN